MPYLALTLSSVAVLYAGRKFCSRAFVEPGSDSWYPYYLCPVPNELLGTFDYGRLRWCRKVECTVLGDKATCAGAAQPKLSSTRVCPGHYTLHGALVITNCDDSNGGFDIGLRVVQHKPSHSTWYR